MNPNATETTNTSEPGIWVFLLFAIVPLGVGVALLWVRATTLAGVESAESWVATPCVVEQAEFETHDDYRGLSLFYRYEYNGQEYRSDRLDLMPGSMGDDDTWERQLLEAHPAGSQAICYVDPADPASAVLDREHGPDGANRLRLLAFPFLCVGGGFSIAIAMRLSSRLKQSAAKQGREDSPVEPEPPPRRISLLTAVSIVIAGPGGSQVVWLFFVGFSFVFVILGGPALFAELLPSQAGEEQRFFGRIAYVEPLEGHELGESVYQYEFKYEVDGVTRTGTSFTRGRQHDVGDTVEIIDDGRHVRIAGTRANSIPWWICIIPGSIVLLLGFGIIGSYVHNVRVLRLVRIGEVAQLRSARKPGSADVPNAHAMQSFDVDGIEYFARPRPTGAQRIPRGEYALYDPRRPGRNVVCDALLESIVLAGRRPAWIAAFFDLLVPLVSIAAIVLLWRWA